MTPDLLIDIIKRVAMNPHNSDKILEEIRPSITHLFTTSSATASSLITVQTDKPIVFKKQTNAIESEVEVGDLVIRLFNDNELITGIFNGGDLNNIENYTIYNEVNLTEQ